MKCDTVQWASDSSKWFCGCSLVVFAFVVLTGTAEASWMHVGLADQVGRADVIVSGTIAAVRDEGDGEQSVGTIAVLEVIKGDAALKTAEIVFPGPKRTRFSTTDIEFKTGDAGVWLLEKAGDRFSASKHPVQFQPKIMTPLVKMMVADKKDDTLLALYTGWFADLDQEVLTHAANLRLTGPTAVRIARHALSSPSVNVRGIASGWLAAIVTSQDDAKRALPPLIVAADQIGDKDKNGDRNAFSRALAYEAIRQILLRLSVVGAEALARFHWQDLYASAEDAKRTAAEGSIRRATDLAKVMSEAPEKESGVKNR